jgi:hypothetical protein
MKATYTSKSLPEKGIKAKSVIGATAVIADAVIADAVNAIDPFDVVCEDYLCSNQIHAAYESGYICSKCDQPVQSDWPRCPVCGNTKAIKLSNAKPRLRFEEALAKYRPAPADDTVVVEETPKEQ